jgi:hypothetical protein
LAIVHATVVGEHSPIPYTRIFKLMTILKFQPENCP